MKKILILFCVILFIQTNIKAEIVYIDLNFIINNSTLGKSLNKHISELNKLNEEKFKKNELELLEKEKSLVSQQNILNKNEFEKRVKELSLDVKKYRSEKKISLDKIKKTRIENTKKILEIINPIITKYVNENAISLVIPKKNIVVGKKNLDITNEIIKLLNDQPIKLSF